MEGARLAVPSDVSAVAAIAERAAAEFRSARGGDLLLARELAESSIEARLSMAIGHDGAIAVVGCYDDVVFGFGLGGLERLADGRLIAVLSHLVVDADARGVGIGEAMMNLILDRARAMGCVGVDSVALPGDRSTKNFFESFGLKARLLTVHRHLGP